MKKILISRPLSKFVTLTSTDVNSKGRMILSPVKHKMLLGSFSNHAGEHVHQVYIKLVEFICSSQMFMDNSKLQKLCDCCFYTINASSDC